MSDGGGSACAEGFVVGCEWVLFLGAGEEGAEPGSGLCRERERALSRVASAVVSPSSPPQAAADGGGVASGERVATGLHLYTSNSYIRTERDGHTGELNERVT